VKESLKWLSKMNSNSQKWNNLEAPKLKFLKKQSSVQLFEGKGVKIEREFIKRQQKLVLNTYYLFQPSYDFEVIGK
jgi:hypothetical protein